MPDVRPPVKIEMRPHHLTPAPKLKVREVLDLQTGYAPDPGGGTMESMNPIPLFPDRKDAPIEATHANQAKLLMLQLVIFSIIFVAGLAAGSLRPAALPLAIAAMGVGGFGLGAAEVQLSRLTKRS